MRPCLLALLFALAVRSEDLPPPYHFLVVVDTSISMATRKPSVLSGIREMIRFGFSGQIEEGDLIDVWTCEPPTEEDTFPTQEWHARRGGNILMNAAEYVELHRSRRGAHLGPVLERLNSLLAEEKNLLVVLLTDGEEAITLANINPEINKEVSRQRAEAARLQRPLCIAISVVDGKMVEWRVKTGVDGHDLSKLPKREKHVPPAPVAVVAQPPEPEPAIEPEPERPVVLNLPPGATLHPVPIPPPELPTPPIAEIATSPTLADPAAKSAPAKTAIVPPTQALPIAEAIPRQAEPPEPVKFAATHEEPLRAPLFVLDSQALLLSRQPSPFAATIHPLTISNAPTLASPKSESPSKSVPHRAAYIIGSFGGLSVVMAGFLARRPKGTQRSLISRSFIK